MWGGRAGRSGGELNRKRDWAVFSWAAFAVRRRHAGELWAAETEPCVRVCPVSKVLWCSSTTLTWRRVCWLWLVGCLFYVSVSVSVDYYQDRSSYPRHLRTLGTDYLPVPTFPQVRCIPVVTALPVAIPVGAEMKRSYGHDQLTSSLP